MAKIGLQKMSIDLAIPSPGCLLEAKEYIFKPTHLIFLPFNFILLRLLNINFIIQNTV